MQSIMYQHYNTVEIVRQHEKLGLGFWELCRDDFKNIDSRYYSGIINFGNDH